MPDTRSLATERCNRFAPEPKMEIPGLQGGFSECDKNCPAGFTEIQTCDGNDPSDSCDTLCPLSPHVSRKCSTGNRKVCERNLNTFQPIMDNNVRDRCCSLSLTQTDERNKNDCPFAYHKVVRPDGTTDQTEFCKSELLSKCINPRNSDAIIGGGCEALGFAGSFARDVYDSSMKDYCMQDLEHLNIGTCAKWCNDNPQVCKRSEVSKMCQNTTNEKYAKKTKICGCFLNPNIYKNIKDQIERKYKTPSTFLDNGYNCYFPNCADAIIKESPGAPCPSSNLTNCISGIEIDVENNAAGDVELYDSPNCNSEFEKRICDPKCDADKECVDGICEPNSCKSKGEACNYTTQKCVDGKCVDLDKDDKGEGDKDGLSNGVIAAIVITVVLMIGIGLYLALRK
jgi:hypothetical protein